MVLGLERALHPRDTLHEATRFRFTFRGFSRRTHSTCRCTPISLHTQIEIPKSRKSAACAAHLAGCGGDLTVKNGVVFVFCGRGQPAPLRPEPEGAGWGVLPPGDKKHSAPPRGPGDVVRAWASSAGRARGSCSRVGAARPVRAFSDLPYTLQIQPTLSRSPCTQRPFADATLHVARQLASQKKGYYICDPIQ